jgi:hypothetical protein
MHAIMQDITRKAVRPSDSEEHVKFRSIQEDEYTNQSEQLEAMLVAKKSVVSRRRVLGVTAYDCYDSAVFAYSKADEKSQKGRSRTAKKMFGASDRLFERLSEYLSEKIVGHHDLEAWFDRPLATGVEDSFGLDPDSFPQIINS